MRLVVIESPFASPTPGGRARNLAYARAALRDCLLRGESPLASHLLFTQPGVLDDDKPEERELGIAAGLEWGVHAAATVVYDDLGVSRGMKHGISDASRRGRAVEWRSLPGWAEGQEPGAVVDASMPDETEFDPPGRIHPASGPLIAAGPKIPASHSGAVARAEQAALDAAVTEVVEQEAAMPRWGRASTGAPYSSYTWHRWREGSSEAECGETCDGEIVYSEPEPESTCEDCRASETGEVQPEPELAARIAEDAEAGRKTAIEPPAKPPRKPRAPRVCCGPSCTAPGKTAKNASGAKVARSAYLCEAHMRFAETDPALVRAWAGQRAQTAIPGTTEAA